METLNTQRLDALERASPEPRFLPPLPSVSGGLLRRSSCLDTDLQGPRETDPILQCDTHFESSTSDVQDADAAAGRSRGCSFDADTRPCSQVL